jgi:hypothetical protein
MKRILFSLAISTLTLASCTKDSGLGSSADDFSLSSSSSSSTSTPVAVSAVPQSAKNLISSRYSGYSIKEVQQELEHGAKIFQVTVVSGSAKIKLLFDANWNFLGEKN